MIDPKKNHADVGIFETLKVTAHGLIYPKRHWERMRKGGKLLGIEIPDYPQWISQINTYLRENDVPEVFPYALRAEIRKTAGKSEQWMVSTRAVPYTGEHYEQGVRVLFITKRRIDPIALTYIKSTDYLDTTQALKAVQSKGAFEGIWLNNIGQISEGTRSNIFFVRNSTIYTPSLDCGCLAGTRRQLVKEKADELGLTVIEGYYLPEDILQAEEVFLTNSLMGIMPVRQLENTIYPDGRIGKRLCIELGI